MIKYLFRTFRFWINSHAHQPSSMSDRLTFKTVSTKLAIALLRTDIALLSTVLHERSHF
ncbi:MAG: hypothetical protein RMZ42_31870 [Nostoc sp. DedQUE05]|uniref:hypothetical protein n=1 Tax=Nostoc sp. DedQUE05 TaxID=3075391 RepID=UPI002AD25A0A|nr:hypothetical protein [Nostoc sp. DedQUE05]MDZ8096502.1 hypothetical protein [Nostoc sp. DedQUE05]